MTLRVLAGFGSAMITALVPSYAGAASTWAHVLTNGSAMTYYHSGEVTEDGGSIAFGGVGNKGASSVYVVKHDAGGQVLWQKKYREKKDIYGDCGLETLDGGYLVGGDPAQNNDWWLGKLDANGLVQWQKTYGGGGGNYPIRLENRPTPGYFASGARYVDSTPMGGWFILTNPNGAVELQSRWTGINGGETRQRSDGTYVSVGGTRDAEDQNNDDGWIARLDAQGQFIWQKLLQGPLYQYLRIATPVSDGGDLLAGVTGDYSKGLYRILCVKLDAAGNVKWQRSYGDNKNFYWVNAAIETEDKGFLLAGYVENLYKFDALLIKIDRNGKIQWQKIYGQGLAASAARPGMPTDFESFYAVDRTAEATYFAAGWGTVDDALAVRVTNAGEIDSCSGYVRNHTAKATATKYTPSTTSVARMDTTPFTTKQGKAKVTNGSGVRDDQCGAR